ncbi:pyrroline-5-carboxylate reductase [Zobellella iuensis]|uniref:Pyrroline-5-carboxylate reductase n=1 Tax=Zobellella iuensis TaxID=2803811 RepID=A0ABS1QMH4_9GAMM|nr:pyrroline-5-carboxylate reductase [Zobellella iuensis]MBL1376062.1 pyrroline-5-carboxylate reductase [Zobellella iuensis]
MSQKLTFIGAGNMASAIFGGLLRQGYAATDITATSPEAEALRRIRERYGINTQNDNVAAVAQADVVVLAIKPQVVRDVCLPLCDAIRQRSRPPLIISIVAGIEAETISHWLGGGLPVVRCMPNTPALVGTGASGLFANAHCSTEQRELAGQLLGAVGLVEWVDNEPLIDAVTAVSGSGPAYFFMFFSAMEDAGVALGLPRAIARRLALQTGLGAARMALAGDKSPAQLMRDVMSPQGTTERAITTFEYHELNEIVHAAMEACALRAREMRSDFV